MACTSDNGAAPNPCGTHEVSCAGSCWGIGNAHCGDCNPCGGGLSCVATAGAMNGYACGCELPSIQCIDVDGTPRCVDPRSPDHCGTCENTCAQGAQCIEDYSQGFLADGTHPLACLCRAPYAICNGACVDILEDDASNCGSCGKHCSSAEQCVNGACLAH